MGPLLPPKTYLSFLFHSFDIPCRIVDYIDPCSSGTKHRAAHVHKMKGYRYCKVKTVMTAVCSYFLWPIRLDFSKKKSTRELG